MEGQFERLRATLCALIGEQTEKASAPVASHLLPSSSFSASPPNPPGPHPSNSPVRIRRPSAPRLCRCVGETLCVENKKPFYCISLMKNKGLARDEMHTHEMGAIYITGDGWF